MEKEEKKKKYNILFLIINKLEKNTCLLKN